ncbi:MAG: HAMP domain-containing sensor histidine kinase [Candidatus Moraniibacteriota bacterium]
MKMQEKYTLGSVLIVLIVMGMTFFLINQRTNDEFRKFTVEKLQAGQPQSAPQQGGSERPPQVPANPDDIRFAPDSPEARFVKATQSTLLTAGVIGVILAVVMSLILGSLFLGGVFRLQNAMKAYMDGGKPKRVTYPGNDEVGSLTEVYNALIEKVDRQEGIRKEFFIDLSHELRTPLTAVKGYLEGLSDGVFASDKEREIERKALAETDRMIHLVKEMTILAKLEADNRKISKVNVALREITEEAAESSMNELRKNDMQVCIIGSADAVVNRDTFKQIVLNLLDNAISHGRKGSGIRIDIGKDGGETIWSIRNHADNLSAGELGRVFDRFYRADKGRPYDDRKQHLGIGLNIVRKLVEAHGGNIDARMEGDEVVFTVIV